MTSREFVYWLQGYFEINNKSEILDEVKTEIIKRHLALVFTHEIDPSYPNQQALNAIHNPNPSPSNSASGPGPDRPTLFRC